MTTSSGTQTISGAKTFSNVVTLNGGLTSSTVYTVYGLHTTSGNNQLLMASPAANCWYQIFYVPRSDSIGLASTSSGVWLCCLNYAEGTYEGAVTRIANSSPSFTCPVNITINVNGIYAAMSPPMYWWGKFTVIKMA